VIATVSAGAGAQSPAAAGSAASIIAWNDAALNAAVGVAKQSPPHAIITVALVQAAVYDAVVAIEGGYPPYLPGSEPAPGASVDAAVATAAHAVLANYLPDQAADLDALYQASLAAIADGDAKTAGIAVGQASADALIAARADAGYAAATEFTMPEAAPGAWQIPADQKPVAPWLASYKPFMLESGDQFRPAPPPDLTSETWATDLNEVKELGGAESATRTPEQSLIAQFWSTQPTIQINEGYQHLAADRGLDALETARLFAMTSMVAADAAIACFDAKYEYLFWRPFTAVPGAESDGNDATAADAAWVPLLTTPAHPEYPSAHSCITPAAGLVLSRFLGSDQIDLTLSSTVTADTMPTRTYATVEDLAAEVMEARIAGGIHYRTSTTVGRALGDQVAEWALERYFQPVP
jgi:hypothetical protein